MIISRRAFQSAAAGALAAGVIGPLQGDEATEHLVDCHLHLWDLTKFRLPWLGTGGKIGRNFTFEDYREATAGLGTVHAVYMEVDVAEDQKEAEAAFVIEHSRSGKTPMLGGVIGCRPLSEDFPAYARKFRDEPLVKGFRQVLGGGAFKTPEAKPLLIRHLKFVGDIGKSFDLTMPVNDAAELARACPETRMILDHCGLPEIRAFLPPARRPGFEAGTKADDWKRGIEAVAKCENTICKISGIIAGVIEGWQPEDLAPIVNHCLDSFGPDRVVFGSDWPVCLKGATLKQWVEALRAITADRSAKNRRKLWSDNAIRHYSLKA